MGFLDRFRRKEEKKREEPRPQVAQRLMSVRSEQEPVENRKLSAILDDQPALAEEDHLDFQSYCQALKNLIVHTDTKTPLTLGIFGRWGTGKTTLMCMLEGKLRAAGIATVWFNAWQYGNEDELWAAFLQSILNKMKDDLHLFQEIRFGIKLLWNRIDWRNALEHVVQYLLRILVVVSPVIVTWPLAQQIRQGAYEAIVWVGGGVVSAALGLWVFAKPLIEAVRQNITIDFDAFQQVSDYQEHIAFLDRFREHFEDIVQSLPQKGEKRLVVFIDDLDRCSPERTLQVLDAIKLFVDIKGCIYILGLDLDIVQKAVATKYTDDPETQREYLGKIIQLPFQLPPLTRYEMKHFVKQIVPELPDPRCREVFVEGLVANPREVKRTINVFSLLWNLAATRRGLVDEITAVRLAKVVVIQHAHPDLHKLLQQRPYWLKELEEFFRQEQARELEQETAEELRNAGEPTETEETKEEILLTPVAELSSELQPFTRHETLRSILLRHELRDPGEDDANFANLEPDAIDVYFTLTSRAEAPPPARDRAEAPLQKPIPVVTVGQPQWWNLAHLAREKGETLPAELSLLLRDADFYLLQLACSFRPERDSEVTWARFTAYLQPTTGQENPIAFDLYPREIYDETRTDVKVSIAPSLKFAEVEASPGEVVTTLEFRKLEPVVVGYGAMESAPYWDFAQYKGQPLRGGKFGYLIVKKPHSAEAVRLTLDITADVVTRHGLLSARVTEKDRAHLTQVVCTD